MALYLKIFLGYKTVHDDKRRLALYQPQFRKVVCAERSFTLIEADTHFGRHCTQVFIHPIILCACFFASPRFRLLDTRPLPNRKQSKRSKTANLRFELHSARLSSHIARRHTSSLTRLLVPFQNISIMGLL